MKFTERSPRSHRALAPCGISSARQIPRKAGGGLTNEMNPKRWAHRLSLLLAVAAFTATVVLIIVNITTL